MFKVVDKYGHIQTVYGLDGTYFLIYGAVEPDDETCWRYIEMGECKPLLYSIEQEKQAKQEETKTNLKRRYVWYEDLDGVICCPNCGVCLEKYYKATGIEDEMEHLEPEFCPNCGQHLDWTETRSYGVKEDHT